MVDNLALDAMAGEVAVVEFVATLAVVVIAVVVAAAVAATGNSIADAI